MDSAESPGECASEDVLISADKESPSPGSLQQPDTSDLELNYFNYLTEVEDEFVRRRGSHLLISPMDWALVESWKDAGIPLHIVLRGISKAFDNYDARGNHFRKVNSVLYCQQAVEECFAEYRLAQVGASALPEPSSDNTRESTGVKKVRKKSAAFSKEAVLEFLGSCKAALLAALDRTLQGSSKVSDGESGTSNLGPAGDALDRASTRLGDIMHGVETAPELDAESLELDLDAIDRMLLDKLKEAFGSQRLDELAVEAKAQLRKYKKMDKEMYQQTVNNFVERRIRELGGVPRLSLFYMS